MVPPRSEPSSRRSISPDWVRHSVISPITGCGVARSFSVLLAPARPATLRATSTTAACMP